MRLSKGVHILLPLEVLQFPDALLIPKTEDGRWNHEFTRTSIERYVKKINRLISTAGLADSAVYA